MKNKRHAAELNRARVLTRSVWRFRWLTGSLPPTRAIDNDVGGGHSPPHGMTYRLTAICKLCRSTAVRYGCP
ncbi:hypothetical protein [Paenibacillus polymyxa]|uniref:hypothetical protein n=1 Tax=Paenibacillus polymyxa TaxID=1406 RepID=UPI0025B71B5D|nr:hypothetical protein [Paenibacillus polymyxa]